MSGKMLICALTGAALSCFGTLCGDQPKTTAVAETSKTTTVPSDQEKAAASAASQKATSKSTVTETADAVNKVADYGTGATALRAKKQMESKLKNIQKKSNQRLEKELQ